MNTEENNIQNYFSDSENDLSSSITQTWTEQAIECYSINCDCKKCSLKSGNYSFKCQMPRVINELITLIGKPTINPA